MTGTINGRGSWVPWQPIIPATQKAAGSSEPWDMKIRLDNIANKPNKQEAMEWRQLGSAGSEDSGRKSIKEVMESNVTGANQFHHRAD